MTMYFDFKVDLKEKAVLSCIEWHQEIPLLAVGFSVPESRRTYLNIFNQMVSCYSVLNYLAT